MIAARPTKYRGIQMRSRLEAKMAALFDATPGVTWEYEPLCFADETGQYLPDFRLTFPPRSHRVYVEIKGATPDVEGVQRQMEIIWQSEPSVALWLYEAARDHWWIGCPERGWCGEWDDEVAG